MDEKVIHALNVKGKFVYMYKKGGYVDMGYLRDSNNNVLYFNTQKQAKDAGGNKPCWNVSKITKPLGI